MRWSHTTHNQFDKTESLNKCDGAVARYYISVSAELSHKRSKDRMNNLHLTLIKVESEHTSQNVRRMSTESQKEKLQKKTSHPNS